MSSRVLTTVGLCWINLVASVCFAAEPVAQLKDFTVVVAQHVLLWEGNEIVTWEEIEKRIASQPNPALCYPHFYMTNAVYGTAREDDAKKKMYRLHTQYDLGGHSEGSLWPRSCVRYDRIQKPEDLIPNPALKLDGTILDKMGKPVSEAEVILILPVDKSISYTTYHIETVQGKVRNPLEHVLTHSGPEGEYAIYPPTGVPYYVLAMHPFHGFALVTDTQLQTDHTVKLQPWGTVLVEYADPATQETTDLNTGIKASEGRPEISFQQYWDDLDRAWKEDVDPQGTPIGFLCVPPNYEFSVSRSFPQGDGGSISVGQSTVVLKPGQTRKLSVGPVTDEMRKKVDEIRKILRQRD